MVVILIKKNHKKISNTRYYTIQNLLALKIYINVNTTKIKNLFKSLQKMNSIVKTVNAKVDFSVISEWELTNSPVCELFFSDHEFI